MVTGDKWISFDNAKSIKMKANFAVDQNLAGVMVWSIETDDFNGENMERFWYNVLIIFIGNCNGGKYPLLTALNEGLTEKVLDDGGECNPEDYPSTTTPEPTPEIQPVVADDDDDDDNTIDDQDDCKCNSSNVFTSPLSVLILTFLVTSCRN